MAQVRDTVQREIERAVASHLSVSSLVVCRCIADHRLSRSLLLRCCLVECLFMFMFVQVFNSVAVVVGCSSLVNIPRVPLDLVRGTVGLGLAVAGNLSSGITTILSSLTFDEEYINQRHRVRMAERVCCFSLL